MNPSEMSGMLGAKFDSARPAKALPLLFWTAAASVDQAGIELMSVTRRGYPSDCAVAACQRSRSSVIYVEFNHPNHYI
jgi:hypothetical protein